MSRRRIIALAEARMLGLPPPLTLFQCALLRIGLVRRNHDDTLRGPFYVASLAWWKVMLSRKCTFSRIGFFRNHRGVIDRVPGSWLPRRWGFFILGFEFGQRS